MADIVKAPGKYDKSKYSDIVFLAGSIEMGAAEKWQDRVTEILKDQPNLLILNPRREDWDSSWEQKIENEQFREQVEWELQGQEDATTILMYFDPKTKSPITLLELGLFAEKQKLIVCCPEGFWRKGNVDIVCRWYNISTVETLEEFLSVLKEDKVDHDSGTN